MTKRQRAILFSICAFLFIVSSLAAVFYSQGYRFDFEKKRTTQTGAFYFKVFPKSAEIYLDDKLKKKTDFFFGAALIENLLPKKYRVEIKKEGYHSWKKTLETTERQVTEAKNIVLIPENPKFHILTKNVENFFFAPDEKKIILKEVKESKPSFPPSPRKRGSDIEDGFSLKLFDLEKNVKSHLIKNTDISTKKIELSDLKFSPDSRGMLLEVGIEKELKYFFLDLDYSPQALQFMVSLDFLGKNIENLSFNPKNPQKLFFKGTLLKEKISQNFLFEGDLKTKEISQILLTDLVTYQVWGENIFWLSPNGFLFKSDLSGKNQERVTSEPLSLNPEVRYQLYLNLPRIFLKEGETLYLFDQDLKSFKKFFEPAKDFSYSPDFKKMAYFSHSEIWILFLERIYDQPQKEELEKLFLTRFSEKIDNLFWFTSHYLIFNVGSLIKIAEIDDRDRINIYDFAEFEDPLKENKLFIRQAKIFWNSVNKKLYILSGENLFSSEKLLP